MNSCETKYCETCGQEFHRVTQRGQMGYASRQKFAQRKYCSVECRPGGRGRVKWTDEILAETAQLRREGLTYQQCAERLSRHPGMESVNWQQVASALALEHKRATVMAREMGRKPQEIDEPPPIRPERRPCLCCGEPFTSEHYGNRLCTNCRRKSTNPFEENYA